MQITKVGISNRDYSLLRAATTSITSKAQTDPDRQQNISD